MKFQKLTKLTLKRFCFCGTIKETFPNKFKFKSNFGLLLEGQ